MLPQTLSEKSQLKKNAKYRKLELWPNPERMLSKSARGITMENQKWLQYALRSGINFNHHITWTQDKVKVVNVEKLPKIQILKLFK